MAKQMALTDQFGANHPNAYFRVVQVNIGVDGRSAQVVFNGYHNKAARNEGKPPFMQKVYDVQGGRFDRLLAEVLEGKKNVVALSYQVAKETSDDVPEDQRGFFDTATDDN